MANRFVGVCLGFALILGVAATARATPIWLEFSGTIVSSFGGLPAPVDVSGSLVYDPDSPDPRNANQVLYGVLLHHVDIDGLTELSGTAQLEVTNDLDVSFGLPGGLFLDRFSLVVGGLSALLTPNIEIFAVGFQFESTAPVNDDLVSLDAPTSLGDLAGFGSGDEQLFNIRLFVSFDNLETGGAFSTGTNTFDVSFTPVPEPSTALLVAASITVLGLTRRAAIPQARVHFQVRDPNPNFRSKHGAGFHVR
jgi:hypothetical protein